MDNVRKKLLGLAMQARSRAYAPYSGFRVGAAILAVSGNIYTGCNVENASLGLSCCAERAALYKAVSEGEKKFLAVAVAGDVNPCTPCGACRQVLAEFGGDIRVYLYDGKGELMEKEIDELLPLRFRMPGGDSREERCGDR